MVPKLALFVLLAICGLVVITGGETDLHEIVTNFARKLFKVVISKSGTENVILSPYAIQRLIMVALQAARGPLYASMQQSLEVDCIGDVLTDGLFKNYPPGFHYVDQIFHTVETTLRIPYILLAKILFNVSPETINLNSTRTVAKQINTFVKKASSGMITKYFTSADISNETAIYFINAVYFEGHWDTPFNKKDDRFGRFFEDGLRSVNVKHMYSVQYVNYAKLSDVYDAACIELPYKDASEKMLIILPKSPADLSRVQSKIMGLDFPIILKRMKSSLVAISLPHFFLEFRTDLAKVLPAINMETLFAPNVDLTNGFDVAPPSMVPRLYQKAFFDINHYGSIVDVPRSNRKKPTTDDNENEVKTPEKFFLVEHPFLFFLHTNGTIHFVGSVNKVNQSSEHE